MYSSMTNAVESLMKGGYLKLAFDGTNEVVPVFTILSRTQRGFGGILHPMGRR